MIKKLLVPCLFVTSFTFAQYVPSTPWMEDLKKKNQTVSKSNTSDFSIDELRESFDEYWKTPGKEPNKKGSGYKPFKRWENYWSYFAKSDGHLPTASELWQAWEMKQQRNAAVNPVSNWVSIGPNRPGVLFSSLPGTGRINAMAVDPNNENIWYAGAPAGGIWKSTDAGINWVNVFDQFPQIGVSGIAIDPNDSDTIYIATGDDDAFDSFSAGVFKSTDGGSTWDETGINPSNQNEFDVLNEIVIDPTNSNRIWVGGTDGLQLSEDAGATWTVKLSRNVTDFKLKPGDPNTIYAVDENEYFKSDNGGDNFRNITDILPTTGGRIVLGVSAADPTVLYVLVADTINNGSGYLGLFKSTDSGESFEESPNTTNIFESSQAWFDLALEVDPSDANIIYTGCLNIWKSTNGGDSFSRLNQWFLNTPSYTHADIHTLKFFGDKLFCGSDGGLYVTEDGGATFTDFTGNMAVSQFYRISIAKNNASKIVGGTQDNAGYSLNNGLWNVYTGGDGMDYEIDPTNPNIAYGFLQFGDLLYITTNLGETVATISAPSDGTGTVSGNWITPLALDGEGTVYAAYQAIYRLDGSSWERVSDFITGENIDDLEIDQNNPSVMYAAEADGLYRSQDAGVTFKLIESFGTQISDIAINSNDSNIVYVSTSNRIGTSQADQPSGQGIHKVTISGNALVSNDNITFNLPTDQAYFSIAHQPRDDKNPVYVGTSLGVYRIDDTLTEWEDYFTNLPNVAVGDIEISTDDQLIIASTYGRGIWQSPIPVTPPESDIKLISISPESGTTICGEIIPQITVKNSGIEPIDEVEIFYQINGETEERTTFSVTINSGELTQLSLPSLAIDEFSNVDLIVRVNIENDAFSDNNTQRTSFLPIGFSTGNQLFDLETKQNSLIPVTLSGVEMTWERGVPTGTLLNEVSSGTQVFATNLDGNHPDATKAVLLSSCYELSAITAPVLKFDMAYDLEINFDIVYVEYSTDNGSNWSILGELGSQPNWYNSDRTNESSGVSNDCQNCPGAQWTGTNATLTEYSYDFSANAANGEVDLTAEDNIIFRIVFQSDPSVFQEGVIIDDFIIEGTQTDDDTDNDGILDVNDNCPLIGNADQSDLDGDGEGDFCDLDDDGDSILDIDDNCRIDINPDQEDFDNDGIGDLCDPDIDDDGILNDADACDNTPIGAVVDFDGCEIFSLSQDNFQVKSIGESCIASNNGRIEINTTNTSLNYTAVLSNSGVVDTSNSFSDTTVFENLSAGNYTLCLMVENQTDFELCFEINITEPEPLGVSSKINSLNNSIELNLSGSDIYFIEINGVVTVTLEEKIVLPLPKIENVISVKTDKECQGSFDETIILSQETFIYPNPVTNGELTVFLGQSGDNTVETSLFDLAGNQIMNKSFNSNDGTIKMNVSGLSQGIYLLNIKSDDRLFSYKILKK